MSDGNPPEILSDTVTRETVAPGREGQSDANLKPSSSEPSAPSPNTMRKRRREEIARKFESRKALMSTASSTRLDMSKVHSILSGPRLSWDWQGGTGGVRKQEVDDDDDSCGLIVDFHQDSRSALRTHINQAMSQMASRDISSQSVSSGPLKVRGLHSEELKEIIQSKRRLIHSQAHTQSVQEKENVENKPDTDATPLISMWQETQMVSPSDVEATQVFIREAEDCLPVINERRDKPAMIEEEEEEMILEGMEPTQIYVPENQETSGPTASSRLREMPSKASSLSIPPNSIRETDSDGDVVDAESSSEEEDVEEEVENYSKEDEEEREIKKKKVKDSHSGVSFEEWLAERNRKRKQKKSKSSKEAKGFFEAEAEESEDEELGGIMRRSVDQGSDDEGSSSSSSNDMSDLEDLVASAKDEFELLKKSGKDSSKLAKLHAQWLDERDSQLQKAIEDKDFWKRRGLRGLKGLDEDGGSADGLNRMQRKLKAKRAAYVEKFDSEGNLLAPEYMSGSESDYDSMEIDSDDFIDEFSDEENARVLNDEEIAIRKQRREREQERRKRDKEMKAEMMRRRQLLKEKLREEKLMKQKDKRELQTGLAIMSKEDQEVFKLVSRTQGVFGYTQTGGGGGITTQSTSASSSSQSTPVFSFLGPIPNVDDRKMKTRRLSAASLELE